MNYSLELLEKLYEQCLNLPPGERVSFIEQSGQESSLKNILLRMLDENDNAKQYFRKLQEAVIDGIQDEPIPELKTGEIVGNYRIISFLAKGGMSNLYLAERADGQFEQQVAIKCLSSREFLKEEPLSKILEQQILAKLRHPNITTLYDAGITSGNIPYFIMEYIDGIYAEVPLLLQDIRNFRTKFPVSAVSAGVNYRLSKFVRRHKTAVLSFLLIGLSLIVETVVSLWQAKQAQQQRDLAQKSEQVSVATKNFLLDLFMTAHPSINRGDTMTVFQFLDKGYEEAEAYSGSPEIKLEMLTTIGKLYRTLGDYTKSKEVLGNAYALAKDSGLQLSASYILAIEQIALFQRDIGNYDSAYILMNQVLGMYSDINYPEKDSMYTASLKYQAFICKYLEKTDSAILLVNKAIQLEEQLWPNRNNINLAGDYEVALKHSKRATEIATRLFGHDHKETATAIDNLGGVFLLLQRYDSAYYYYKSGLDVRQKIYPAQENQHLMNSNNNLLSLFITSNQADSAKKYLVDALRISASGKVHARQRSFTYSLAGDYYEQWGKRDSAIYYYLNSLSESKTYLPENDDRLVSVQKKMEKLN